MGFGRGLYESMRHGCTGLIEEMLRMRAEMWIGRGWISCRRLRDEFLGGEGFVEVGQQETIHHLLKVYYGLCPTILTLQFQLPFPL